jgi:hypothetical protein
VSWQAREGAGANEEHVRQVGVIAVVRGKPEARAGRVGYGMELEDCLAEIPFMTDAGDRTNLLKRRCFPMLLKSALVSVQEIRQCLTVSENPFVPPGAGLFYISLPIFGLWPRYRWRIRGITITAGALQEERS